MRRINFNEPLESRHVDPETGGEKGNKQARYDLIPTEPLYLLANHYGIGSLKYDDDNWKKGYDWKFSYAALQRHANEWWEGYEWGWETFVNRETGEEVMVQINHMVAVAWHAFALLWFSENMRGKAPSQFNQSAQDAFCAAELGYVVQSIK